MKKRAPFRTVIQTLSLCLFLLLLFAAVYPLRVGVPYDLFLCLDPLVALGALSGSRQVPGDLLLCLIVVALTLVAGRLFCGYLCPLGTVVDLSDKTLAGNRRIGHKQNGRYRRFRNVKVYFLIALLVAGVLGVGLLYAFDPISLLTRTFASVLYPLAMLIRNLLLGLLRPLAGVLGWVGLANAQSPQPVSSGNILIFLLFVCLLSCAFLSRRFWCRYLCPLGGLLGLLSRVAVVRRRVSGSCTSCGLCRASCPMDAIPENPTRTLQSECIGCRTCEQVCPEDAVSFGWSRGTAGALRSEVDFSRRGLLCSAGGALSLAFLASTAPPSTARRSQVRPPGALPEEWFNATCIRCGECVKACITNTLQPSPWEAGLDGLWTPHCDMRLAGCEQSCNVCGTVCPTQAIRALPLEEKKFARMGTAHILRGQCIAWEQDRLCLICDEACPYNAIVFQVVGGFKRPFVDEQKCNGCGICEQVCPVTGEAAIRVTPAGEVRLRNGSYAREAERLGLVLRDRTEKDRLDETLPPGFLP